MYYVVSEILPDSKGESISHVEFGYCNSKEVAVEIDEIYHRPFFDFVKENHDQISNGSKKITEYFTDEKKVYVISSQTDTVVGMDLVIIRNPNKVK